MANSYESQWDVNSPTAGESPAGVPTFPVGGPTDSGAGSTPPPSSNPFREAFTTPVSGGRYEAVAPFVPGLSSEFTGYLESQIGKGAQPYGLQAFQPTTGRTTQPGQLSADVNPMLHDLGQFVSGAAQDPSMGVQPAGGTSETLDEMLRTGAPISTMPQFEAIEKAMDRQYKQGRGDIRAQMAGLGLIAGTPHTGAQTDYALQAAREKTAIMTGLETGALESAQGRRMQALGISSDFFGLNQQQQRFFVDQSRQIGEIFQGMDRAAIDRTMAEFLRTRPEYGPLLNLLYGLSTTFAPQLAQEEGLGSVGALLGNIGTGLEIFGDLASGFESGF